MSFWRMFLDPHLTKYQPSVGVHNIFVLDVGVFALSMDGNMASLQSPKAHAPLNHPT